MPAPDHDRSAIAGNFEFNHATLSLLTTDPTPNVKPHTLLRRIVVMIMLISMLAACGQRGALYLPEKGKPKKTKSSTAKKVEAIKPHGPTTDQTNAKQPDVPAVDDESDENDNDEQ